MKKRTKMETANKVVEIASAADNVSPVLQRALEDMPSLVHHPGAKEVAVLTVVAKEQAFSFKPVMDALEFLAANDSAIDWSREFLVAHEFQSRVGAVPYFNWREAPTRAYKSFNDFYSRELESIWGRWEDLRKTYARVVSGEITSDEGARIVLGKRGTNQFTRGSDNITSISKQTGRGTSRAYILARLDRDGRTELAAKVRSGELSANAAAIEAGWRKRMPVVERALKLVENMTPDQRQEFFAAVKKFRVTESD